MAKNIRYILTIYFFLSALTVFSQISELHLVELNNCIPTEHKDAIASVEQSYKEGVTLYNDARNTDLDEQGRIEKLTRLFKIQVSTKVKLQEIWELSDSTTHESSAKYFTEASKAYKGLTDTINLDNPNFRSTKSALIVVERTHQVILLQKFGLQVLFGCVRESSGRLGQPTDISNDIVINIDMIERFRKVWNETNYPMTYDQWEYKPSERKGFSKQLLTDSYKDRFVEKEKNAELNASSQEISPQISLAVNASAPMGSRIVASNDKANAQPQSDNVQGVKNSRSATGEWTNNVTNQSYSIKGEASRLGINQNTQFEIKSMISHSMIKTLGIEYFAIQIAASKNQLVTETLKKDFYCGNLGIEEKNESGWYKYLVGHFTSIDSANSYLASPCLTRGFVSGYNAKGRVAILSIKQPVATLGDGSAYSIVYRVQIAASRQPITSEALSAIYKGFNPVNASHEDGWYRYSIGDFIYYGEAKVARDSCGTKDAFVMPYQNAKRIQWPTKSAMEYLKIKQAESPIYVVQVAASRKPLSLQIIKDIIKVDYPLTMKFEDGWYKYYISAFTDFAVAKEVATKISIKGAFIATYRNGLRLKP